MEIIIQPVLAGINDSTLNDLVNDVSREFEGNRVTLARADDTTIGSVKNDDTLSILVRH